MFGAEKLRILAWSVTISTVLSSCSSEQISREIHGETQGTTYSIILVGDYEVDKTEIDSIFSVFDRSLSTYIDSSVVSRLNNSLESTEINDPSGFFNECYKRSMEIYLQTGGVFDPSVFPLVKGWGFMNDIETPLTQLEVDSILAFVSFEKDKHHAIDFDNNVIHYIKNHPGFKLDFNAIAQGFSVDVIDRFLREKGCENYYIEVGGEIVVKGYNADGVKWRIGIDTPVENLDSRELENIIHISDKAIATSGNYRKYYIHDGVKYAHTLDPKTGFPVQHSLLSATVVANDCATADAYATVFMVLGVDRSMDFLKNHPEAEIEVYLLYSNEKGEISREISKGFSEFLKE